MYHNHESTVIQNVTVLSCVIWNNTDKAFCAITENSCAVMDSMSKALHSIFATGNKTDEI